MGFHHLSCAERAVVFSEERRGSSQREIAGLLGRSASTICRELARGRGPEGGYCPQRSQAEHDRRRLRCRPRHKLVAGGALWRYVCRQLLQFRWSPEQIAATLARMTPDDPAARVSHETIYAMIYAQARGGLKAAMTLALRQGKPRRGTRRRTLAGSAIVPERLKILYRPEEVEARLVPGHWEGDLIKGAYNRSSVGTLVERKTRLVTLAKMEGNGAEAALEGFTRQMRRLPGVLRRSLTYDRGLEMACHPELARRLKIDIWLGRPPCALATRVQREHQRASAPVPAKGRGPDGILPARPRPHRQAHERSAQKDPRLENPRRSLRRGNHKQRSDRCSWYLS
jgi:IS30 family transposase